MNHYELEVAKIENRTPLFYYPYSVELKSDFAREMLAVHFRDKFKRGPVRPVTQQDLALVNDENMKTVSGKIDFHYNDPKETEGTRIGIVKALAREALGNNGIDAFRQLAKNVKTYGAFLIEGKDFEIIVGERVDIEQPKKLTFDDLPDLMGINEA
ncbi:hypothetical protein ACFOZY_03155 [Chungangia koreensis]|uniref:DNA-directed RNA polymerase n=1 Tax=Chungangia koreensis TaxID=752657 RepID=A0ABV8X1K5_9LACT